MATYLALLLFSLTGMLLLDGKFKLAFFKNAQQSWAGMALCVTLFLIWDAFGIALGIFFRGDTSHLTGILLAPELPIEEVFFLMLLSYVALALVDIADRILKRVRR